MLQDNNIQLRELHHEDAGIIALLANNKKIWDNVRDYFPHPYSVSDAWQFLDMIEKQQPPATFGIVYDTHLCGVISTIPQPDVYKQSVEIGYWIGEPYWNKGIATIAVKLITDYALHQLNYARIHAGIFEYNIPSMKVLEKNGYMKEGISKKAITKNGALWDEHRYAKTK